MMKEGKQRLLDKFATLLIRPMDKSEELALELIVTQILSMVVTTFDPDELDTIDPTIYYLENSPSVQETGTFLMKFRNSSLDAARLTMTRNELILIVTSMKKVIDNYLVEDYRQTCYTEPDEESSEGSEDGETEGVNPFWDTHYFYHFRDCLRRFAPMTPIAILQNLSEAAELGD